MEVNMYDDMHLVFLMLGLAICIMGAVLAVLWKYIWNDPSEWHKKRKW